MLGCATGARAVFAARTRRRVYPFSGRDLFTGSARSGPRGRWQSVLDPVRDRAEEVERAGIRRRDPVAKVAVGEQVAA